MSSLFPPTTRVPRLTRASEGKPLRRLLVTSKALGFEGVFALVHGTPPARPIWWAAHPSLLSID